jgi:hypothetical protein
MDASADEEVCDRVDKSQISFLQPVRQYLHAGDKVVVWETRKSVRPGGKSKKAGARLRRVKVFGSRT